MCGLVAGAVCRGEAAGRSQAVAATRASAKARAIGIDPPSHRRPRPPAQETRGGAAAARSSTLDADATPGPNSQFASIRLKFKSLALLEL